MKQTRATRNTKRSSHSSVEYPKEDLQTDIDGEPDDDDSYSESAGSHDYRNTLVRGASAISEATIDDVDKTSANEKIAVNSDHDSQEEDQNQDEIPSAANYDDEATSTEAMNNYHFNQGLERRADYFLENDPSEFQSKRCRYEGNHSRHAKEKPPIIFDSSTDIPEALKHLPEDARITIFDRKAGIVLVGVDAPKLCDLPHLLSQNAGYEPVYPDMYDESSPSNCRIGKSGEKVRIRASICPQNRVVRAGRSMQGKRIVVKSGAYQGSTGKITSALNGGGWFRVSGLEDIEVIVKASDVECVDVE
mmetsp:Transcript_4512/g.6890  ORF Transcript_4512/g.6890 Transcript_4512/m.6890 type:complete len:305 (+) Transcript_4512:68-982(+)|eukprot:CAMPEP_0196811910 /NCGR_PEP_ID=MMETSP1362-20130617/20128_1 /TAXON_ID=163516 /ORGANISM="Leptocylindrus danicus, Strain CCMP1856" /LENGTH=304 /DNA_ID=CAMNT_0042187313 /DNA_START=28 /DNA_END=942 /DNA_ORIENTATION=+